MCQDRTPLTHTCPICFVLLFISLFGDEKLPLRPSTPGLAMLVPPLLPSLHKYFTTTSSSKPSPIPPSFADKLKEMEKSKMRCCMGLFLVLLLVLATQEAEGRMCQSQSHGFRGSCVSSHNCALVCRNEGFSGGRCSGFRRRCFCTKLC